MGNTCRWNLWGLAGLGQLWIQLYGTLSIGAFIFVFAFLLLFILKKTIGIRVSAEEEERGLDISEHDMKAYGEQKELERIADY